MKIAEQQTLSLETLLNKNTMLANEYRQRSQLMTLIRSDYMHQKQYREKLLDAIQVFSNYFQKVVALRNTFCEEPEFLKITEEHLQEEFGHHLVLLKDRAFKPPVWDAILEATSSWFSWKMLMSDNEDKVVLVHLVLETSANIFFQEAQPIMEIYKETSYFETHAEIDASHEDMGKELLDGLSEKKYLRLFEIQRQGWDMMNAASNRMAELAMLANI